MTVFEKLRSCETVAEMVHVLYLSKLNKGMKWLTNWLESEYKER